MVQSNNKNLLAFLMVASSSMVFASNTVQKFVSKSPVDPVAALHGLAPKNMAQLFTYGALVAALVPTAVSLVKVYVRKQQGAKVVSPVEIAKGEDNRYGLRLGYFGVHANVPKDGSILSKVCGTSLEVSGVTTGKVTAALLTAYVTRQVIGKN